MENTIAIPDPLPITEYGWTGRIAFPPEVFEEARLSTARIVAHFRRTVDLAILYTADTAAGTVARVPEASELILTVTPEGGLALTLYDSCAFDLLSIGEAGAPDYPLPGRFVWPVEKRVTRKADIR